MADMNQYCVTLYAPIVAVDRSILEYAVGTILAIYGKPMDVWYDVIKLTVHMYAMFNLQ